MNMAMQPGKDTAFDEERFVSECLHGFADIRKKYNLEEDLEKAQQNLQLQQLAEEVAEGCTQQGILAMAGREPEWTVRKVPYRWRLRGFPIKTEVAVSSKTDDWIKRMKRVYDKKCKELYGKVGLFKEFPQIIREKEKQAAAGDVKAMVFLGKVYEKGTLCSAKDEEKGRSYLKKAREAYTDDLNKRYTLWLDRIVQRSGMELIGRIGREYMAGTLIEEGKKNRELKLRKEMRWLRSATKTGDGWAAFTLGHIYYYGYGQCRGRMREAYDNYSLAESSKDAIYALEMGNLCFDEPGGIDRELEDICRWKHGNWFGSELEDSVDFFNIEDDYSRTWFEENMKRDFLAEAQVADNEGDYETAWLLARRAMFSGDGMEGESMQVKMVKEGKWNPDIENMKDEPEVIVEGKTAKSTVCVKNYTGICETSAAILAGMANRFQSNIEIHRENHKVNAKQVIMIEALGLIKGTTIEIWAEGEDAEEAVRSLVKLIINRFGEQ
ncbi:HPr family phosphocarrier protein [Selenomonas ruminantium]|uniref:HPr family phosphocarrier protein n=1 Tax=Selenomonas ruminantium TaxID=971 RepID=UPI0026F09D9D|nr:HPr family phosphocarrier protein [Selenomonas ruminantium]